MHDVASIGGQHSDIDAGCGQSEFAHHSDIHDLAWMRSYIVESGAGCDQSDLNAVLHPNDADVPGMNVAVHCSKIGSERHLGPDVVLCHLDAVSCLSGPRQVIWNVQLFWLD